MIALTGSRLNITDENHSSSVEDLNQFCSGCGGEWNAPLNTHGCLMNTSTNEGCPTFHLLPCVDYKIRLFPKIWDVTYEPLDSLVESTTIAGRLIVIILKQTSLNYI